MNTPQKAALCLALVLALGPFAACSRPDSGPPARPRPGQEAEPAPQEANPPPPAAPEREPVLLPSGELMMETIGALCEEPRPLGSEAELRAAQYLQERLEEYGYGTELESFPFHISGTTLSQRYQQARDLTGEDFLAAALLGDGVDGHSQNVVGRLPAEGEKDKILVLSAHYDSTPDSIGVVDNASGVAVVLEAARILAGEELPFSLRIVFFGGEEEILIGSRLHLLNMEPEERDRILGNISVDTLAYSDREEFVVLTPLLLEREDSASLAGASPVAAALLADSRVSPAFRSRLVGDHMAFSAIGIDSVNFGQSMDEVADRINSPLDTYDLLEPALLPTAAGLLADAVRELARREDL